MCINVQCTWMFRWMDGCLVALWDGGDDGSTTIVIFHLDKTTLDPFVHSLNAMEYIHFYTQIYNTKEPHT